MYQESSNRNSMDSTRSMSVNPQQMPPLPVTPTPQSREYTALPLPTHAYGYQVSRTPPPPIRSMSTQAETKGQMYTTEENSPSRIVEYVAIFLSWMMTIMFFPFVVCTCYKVVREYERAVIFRMGRLRAGAAKGPGTLFILPCVDSCYVLDLRTVTFDVPPQEILTHDAVTVAVDAVVYYRVYNPTIAVSNVEDYNRKGCNSALGLLSVLGLAAYLQNMLQQNQAMPAMMPAGGGRRRRRREIDSSSNNFNKTEDVMSNLVPLLSVVAHAKDKLIPLNCTFREICRANKFLVDKFLDEGRSIAALMSSEIGKMLIPTDPKRGPVILKKVNKVAQLGRSGLPCDLLFEECDVLSFLPNYQFSKHFNIPLDHPLLRGSGLKLKQFLRPFVDGQHLNKKWNKKNTRWNYYSNY